jgi:hypothetical protein
LEKFTVDPFDPSLKTHKLSGKLNELWSFSIDYDEWVISYFTEDEKAHPIGYVAVKQTHHEFSSQKNAIARCVVRSPILSVGLRSQNPINYDFIELTLFTGWAIGINLESQLAQQRCC